MHEPRRRLPALLGNDDRADDAQLDVVESCAGLLTDPSELVRDGFRQKPRRVWGESPGSQGRGLEADDVGLTRREREHPPASRAHEYGWVRLLDRLGKHVQMRDGIKAAR